jgi:hypothetical protein
LTCLDDFKGAYNNASVATCQSNLPAAALDGLVLGPGVYCSAPGIFSLAAAGILTLDAQGSPSSQWIFQTATTVVTGAGSSIKFVNGGQANNVYWAVGTSVTIGANADFIGNILAQVSITLGYQSTLRGRAFALTTVTFAGDVTTVLPAYVQGLEFTGHKLYHFDDVNYADKPDAELLEGITGFTDNFTNLTTATPDTTLTSPFNSESKFSVEWKGYFYAAATGEYNFATTSDDGSFLWLNNDKTSFATSGRTNALVNNGGEHVLKQVNDDVSLTEGKYYFIRILFGEESGKVNIIVTITNPDNSTSNGVGVLFHKTIV